MKKTTKAGIAVAAVAAVATSAMVISAFGPDDRQTYTMENPADKVTFNSITNNPTLIGATDTAACEGNVACDERYFVSASEYTGDASKNSWGDTTTVEDGKEYVVRMYVHNDAASNLNLVAENVKAYVNLPTDTATSITVQGILTSSNADPGKVWDETTFVSGNGEAFNLAYVDGTAKYTNCDESTRADDRTCTSTRKFDLDSNLFTSNGSTLGYSEMDGRIPGCIGYSGWVTFHVKAQFAAKPSYNIEKSVKIKGADAEYTQEVNAKSGDELVYRLHFTNTGNVNVYDVVLRDTLPQGVTFKQGSAFLVTPENPDGLQLDDSVLFSQTGVNIGSYAPNSEAYIFFNVTVDAGLSDECANTMLQNVIEVIAKNEGGADLEVKKDTAEVYVDGRVCTESFDIDKMVRLENDKEWSETVKAKAGEKVYYRIRFFNTGETDLDNVVVKDKLPEHMTNISAVNYGVIVEGKDSKLTTGEGFFDGGMNIGTVKAGETVGIYFSATVDEALADECEDITLENVVTGKYGDDDSTIKTDNAIVTVDGQVCTEDTPGFELNKMVQVKGSDNWSENVTVKANDTVRYRIQFKNTGNTTLENVVISDTLPAGMNYVEGSTILYNTENTDGKTMGDEVVNGGLNIGSVAAGSEATIYFYATVDNSFADDCEDSKLTNIVAGKYNNDDNTTKTDTADVTVDGIVCETPDVPEYPTTGAESTLGAIIAIASLSAATAGYIISRKK